MKQFISFKIGEEGYAIDIMAVREIKGWTETTPLPNQPGYILGVMNLRGIIVPVYDLRCRVRHGPHRGFAVACHHHRGRAGPDRGLLVDAVSDILTIDSNLICPVPEAECGASADFLSGIIPVNDTMVVILALDELLARSQGAPSSQLNEVQQAA